VRTHEVGDGGDFTVAVWDGTAETDVTPVTVHAIAGTPASSIIRLVRRALLDSGGEPDLMVADSAIAAAFADMLPVVDADLYEETVLIAITDEYTGETLPIGASRRGGVVFPAYLSALAYATAAALVEGALGSAARYAISTESAAGRLNTTAAPEALARYLDILRAKYERAVVRALASSGQTGTFALVDQTDHMRNRGYVIGEE
jgi:hypothetical protein